MSLNKAHQATNARAYRAYAAAKPINAVPSRTLTNATTKGLYTTSKAHTGVCMSLSFASQKPQASNTPLHVNARPSVCAPAISL